MTHLVPEGRYLHRLARRRSSVEPVLPLGHPCRWRRGCRTVGQVPRDCHSWTCIRRYSPWSSTDQHYLVVRRVRW